MKVTLSLPAAVHQEANAAAKDLGVSRSKLIRMALEQFLKERREGAPRSRQRSLPESDKIRKAVSLPEPLLEEARAVAKDIGVSCSRFLRAVIEDFLQRWRPGMFPEVLDDYLAKHGAEPSEEGVAWPESNDREPIDKRKASRKQIVFFSADLLGRAEASAKELGVSRDEFVCIALSDFLVRHNSSEETRQLNRFYIKHPPEPDPFLEYLMLQTMKRVEWKE